MPRLSRSCPEELKEIVRHAERFARMLSRMEEEREGGSWAIGRSGELRALVSSSLADCRAGRSDRDKTHAEIVGYLENLHQGASRYRHGKPFACCGVHDGSPPFLKRRSGLVRCEHR